MSVTVTTPYSQSRVAGDQVKVSAPLTYDVESKHYVFSHWEDNSTNPERTVTVTAPATLLVTYTLINPVSMLVFSGKIGLPQTGDQITLTITPENKAPLTFTVGVDSSGSFTQKVECAPGKYKAVVAVAKNNGFGSGSSRTVSFTWLSGKLTVSKSTQTRSVSLDVTSG